MNRFFSALIGVNITVCAFVLLAIIWPTAPERPEIKRPAPTNEPIDYETDITRRGDICRGGYYERGRDTGETAWDSGHT